MLKILATICIIGMATSSCTSKKASRTESSHEAEPELTMIVGTYTSGDSKGLYSFRFNEENGMFYFDSIRIFTNLEEAKQFGRENGQKVYLCSQ